jgi:iron complex outermembrane receptor protein
MNRFIATLRMRNKSASPTVVRLLTSTCLFAVAGAAAAAALPEETAAGPIEELRVEGTYDGVARERAIAARVPGGVSVVDIEELKQRNVSSLADVMRYVPGVWAVSSTGTDGIFISSRGSNLDATDYDRNGVKLLQDGLPVTTADGNNHNRLIDPLAASAASVARGANAMIYGASTLGGAVNFVTPTAAGREGLEVRLNGGSHGMGMMHATAGASGESLDGLLTVETKTWDGYRDHNEQDRKGLYANAGWQVTDNVTTRFYASWLDNDQELPGALTREQYEEDPDQASPSAVHGDFQLNVETWRLANRTTWQLDGDRRFEFGVSVEEQKLYHPIVDQILVDFDGPGPLQPVEVFSLLIDTDHRDVGAMARYEHKLGDHALSFGVNWGQNKVTGGHFRNLGGEPNGQSAAIDNDAETWELFAHDRWQATDDLALVFAVQGVFADRSTRNTNVNTGAVTAPSGDYEAINPRIGAIYALGERAAVYANASRLFEPPTNFELEDDVRGTSEPLDAMHGTVLELGIRGDRPLGTRGRWYWDTSVYYAWISDEILSMEDPDAPGTSLSTNVDSTVHAGIEALVGAEFDFTGGTLAPMLSLTLNEFSFDGDPLYGNNDLPAAPDYVLRGELMYRHPGGFYAGPTFDLVGERWADFANSYKVDDYGLLGLRSGWNGAKWQVFLEVQNLLDEKYVATHGVRNIAAPDAPLLNPGAPLSAYAGVVVRF